MKAIALDMLGELVSRLQAAGYRVIAPVEQRGTVDWSILGPGQAPVLDHLLTLSPIKEFFFPRSEALLSYRQRGSEVEVRDELPEAVPTVILGARPCDAAALPALDSLFGWDDDDPFYRRRRQATIVVTLACDSPDDFCFCTSAGSGPRDTKGSDLMLSPLPGGLALAEPLSPGGEKVMEMASGLLQETDTVPQAPEVTARFDAAALRQALTDGFEGPAWEAMAARCMSCGVCTALCPTCHCFDIVDEADYSGGRRIRHWDSCMFPRFTVHASGHNPRGGRASRWRQRLMHKFRYYPERFGMVSCTGCGRCGRSCPQGLGMEEAVQVFLGTAGRGSGIAAGGQDD